MPSPSPMSRSASPMLTPRSKPLHISRSPSPSPFSSPSGSPRSSPFSPPFSLAAPSLPSASSLSSAPLTQESDQQRLFIEHERLKSQISSLSSLSVSLGAENASLHKANQELVADSEKLATKLENSLSLLTAAKQEKEVLATSYLSDKLGEGIDKLEDEVLTQLCAEKKSVVLKMEREIQWRSFARLIDCNSPQPVDPSTSFSSFLASSVIASAPSSSSSSVLVSLAHLTEAHAVLKHELEQVRLSSSSHQDKEKQLTLTISSLENEKSHWLKEKEEMRLLFSSLKDEQKKLQERCEQSERQTREGHKQNRELQEKLLHSLQQSAAPRALMTSLPSSSSSSSSSHSSSPQSFHPSPSSLPFHSFVAVRSSPVQLASPPQATSSYSHPTSSRHPPPPPPHVALSSSFHSAPISCSRTDSSSFYSGFSVVPSVSTFNSPSAVRVFHTAPRDSPPEPESLESLMRSDSKMGSSLPSPLRDIQSTANTTRNEHTAHYSFKSSLSSRRSSVYSSSSSSHSHSSIISSYEAPQHHMVMSAPSKLRAPRPLPPSLLQSPRNSPLLASSNAAKRGARR